MKFLSKDNYFQEVKKIISDNESVDIAVAFWGKGAVDIFKRRGNYNKIRIICNLESSGCNPDAIREVKSLGISIRTNRSLHAKVLCAENAVIIGSANISANGLGFECSDLDGWLDAGVLTENKHITDETKMWFESLWTSSLEVNEKLLIRASDIWRKRRINRPMPVMSNESLLDAAKDGLGVFEDRNIYFAIYRNEATKEALESFEETKEEFSSSLDISGSIDFYEDWSELPDNSFLISIYYGKRGKVRVDGVVWTPEDANIVSFSRDSEDEEGELKLCFKRDSIYGYAITDELKSCIKENIDQLWRYNSTRYKPKDEATLVPFSEGMKVILSDY